jgi:hypothetical protein
MIALSQMVGGTLFPIFGSTRRSKQVKTFYNLNEDELKLRLRPHFFHKNAPIHHRLVRVDRRTYIILFTLNPTFSVNQALLKICPAIAWRGEVMVLALGSARIKQPKLLLRVPGGQRLEVAIKL